LGEASQWFHQACANATARDTPNERAYRTGYRVGDDDDGEQRHFTDIDMAFAWLYQDVAHGDKVSTGYFDVTERYRAAVQVFSHLAVVTIQTLHYINDLAARGLLELPVGTFTDPVVVRDREFTEQVHYFETAVGADLSELDHLVPEHLQPALDFEQEDDGQGEAITAQEPQQRCGSNPRYWHAGWSGRKVGEVLLPIARQESLYAECIRAAIEGARAQSSVPDFASGRIYDINKLYVTSNRDFAHAWARVIAVHRPQMSPAAGQVHMLRMATAPQDA
jgi:hypothetical protein